LSVTPGRLAPALAGAATLCGLFVPGSIGAALLYPALAFFPGALLVRALPLGESPLARFAFALALSPLAASLAGWALVTAGVPLPAAARAVAIGCAALWIAIAPRKAPGEPGEPFAVWRVPVLIALAGAALIAWVFFSNPWIRIHSDGWIHGGIVAEILTRGIPPEDPRFAGLPLNYVWFYNFFIALAASLRGDDPFVMMALFNAVNLGATLLVAWVAGRALWGPASANGALLLAGLGFNAIAWMLWPLHFLRAAIGENRGWEGVADVFQRFHVNDYRVIFTFTTPFGYMANVWDKFLVGTAVSYAYLMLLVYLTAMILWFGAGRAAALALAALGALGMLLFHGVVGLSAIPTALGALALAWLLSLRMPGLTSARRIAAFAGATLAGACAGAPYTWSISRGWSGETSGLEHSFLAPDPRLIWTLAIAVAPALWFARRLLAEAWRARRAPVVLLACFAFGMALFASIVRLPLGNHVKFVYQTFLPLALIGGAAWIPAWHGALRRLGPAPAALGFALLFLATPVLTLRGYALDPGARVSHVLRLDATERALYDWIRAKTPADAVVIDAESRDYVMVLARRQLLLGTRFGPELAAFPRDQVVLRRAVMADLYGDQREIARDLRTLDALGRPVYVLYRKADFGDGPKPWPRLAAASPRFAPVYDDDGFVLYHLRSPADPIDPESRP
jgi:hypothetical protein